MDLKKFSTGNFLKAEDVKTIAAMWTIFAAEERQMPDGEKAILSLETMTPKDGHVKKDFTLNMTNINRLDEAFGTMDTEEMIGKRLVLTVEKANFKGKIVDGVRVDTDKTVSVNKLKVNQEAIK